MARFNWNTLTSHSEAPTNAESLPSSGPTEHHRRESTLSHVVDSIQHALAHKHEKLPGDNTAEQHHPQQQNTASGTSGSISPALQAAASSKLDENNMGEVSHKDDKLWGWPGLGTFVTHDSTTSPTSKPRTASTGSGAHMEARVEAATFEAMDNAAESEAYGWPGLGDWPTSPRK